MNNEHPSLNLTVQTPRIEEIQHQLTESKTIAVLPLGIIETAPLVKSIESNAQLTAEALKETAKTLCNLRESVEDPSVNAKLDELLAIFRKLGANAELEREVLTRIKEML